jgi:hypothetical protein
VNKFIKSSDHSLENTNTFPSDSKQYISTLGSKLGSVSTLVAQTGHSKDLANTTKEYVPTSEKAFDNLNQKLDTVDKKLGVGSDHEVLKSPVKSSTTIKSDVSVNKLNPPKEISNEKGSDTSHLVPPKIISDKPIKILKNYDIVLNSSNPSTSQKSTINKTSSMIKPTAELLPADETVGGANGDKVLKDGTIVRANGDTILPNGAIITKKNILIYKDGTIVAPDNTTVNPDGTIVTPNNTVVNSDGTIVAPDNTTVNPDGTIVTPGGFTVYPDGTIMSPKGVIITFDGLGVTQDAWHEVPQDNPT